MTRARNITPRHTAARVERLRNLITALLAGDVVREEMGDILQVGPSGVRKYLADLAGVVEVVRHVDATATCPGSPVYGLAIAPEAAQAYLVSLAANPCARAAKPSERSALSIATRDPARRFHILADDTHYAIRVSRTPIMRDPLVTAFFGAGRHEVRA